ncbi:PLxRFG domain-containing protein [Acinetobacter bereziniae]|uniref:PLxRFG domain-containing protein n=1 Tax=Acinetobacter bereziniae TaxID=106648 RepID=UPI002480B2E4|nr:PLxRFG domain-containing protein [Acinetobacter bereziniae]WMW72933.1 PLxRFG domain-containing protein [Acinetobacter bereziniae]
MSEQKKPWEQNWNQPTANNSDSTNKKPWEQNWSEEKTDRPKDKGFLGQAKDLGVSLIPKGLAGVAELGVGLSDIMSDGATGKILQDKGIYNAKEVREELNTWHTDQYQEQLKEKANVPKQEIKEDDSLSTQAGKLFDNTKEYLKFYKDNPSMIANTVAESIAPMVAGGLLGRATGIANPIAAGAVGEGTVMAGSQAEQIRQETVDGRLTADQSLAGATTGALGGLLGFAGGRLAQKMGIGDVDTMLVTGRAGPAEIAGEIASMPAKSLPRRVVEGAISEGFLEELPQSVSEQILQNLALDKPWHDGIEDAAVMGTLAGMAMGGAANILSGHNTGTESQDNQQPPSAPNLPSAPSQLGSSPDSALAGEYIPRENVPQDDNQGRTAFVYDQPSMEADNLLNNNYKGDVDFDTSGNFDPSNNPLSPSGGNYFEDHSTQPQLPSERLGINPDDGPMSSAAALAVDSGASNSLTPLTDATFIGGVDKAQSAQSEYSDSTAQAIQHGMNEIAQGAKEAAVENTIQRLEKDGEVQLFKEDSIAKALENQNYNVRLNDDGSASIIGVKNPATNQWHGQSKEDASRVSTSLENTVNQQNNDLSNQLVNLEQQFEEAKTVPEKARIRKEINALQQNNTLDQPTETQNKAILGADGQNKWFGSQAKADAFVTQKGITDTHHVVQTENKRFEIQPIDQNQDESGDIRQAKNIDQPSAIENTISASENNISMPKNTILDAQNNIDKTQTNNVVDQLAQLEQQFLDAKSVPQKAKLKKQIDQLKSQQTEITTTPFGSEQIQKQYGDTAESVMSDIEILGDDFTIDLRDDNKKTNALNNPNYNAVQKADGSVEIVGMKHPSTGEWVGKKPNAISIEENAHQAATSSQNNTPEPTQAQIEAGNYKKGHIKVNGLDISIENPKGSERRGTDPNGKEWAHTMSDHYGYIKRTKGADNEHIDTYIGNNPDSNQVFIVDQIDQESGNFDEHKVMLGFDSQEDATTAYQSNFDKGWKVGPIRTMNMEQFKDWLKNEDTSKPATESNPHSTQSTKTSDPFAGNKIFTSDVVAKARERLKKKLGQLNSGIDPEVLIDGMTIAGAYIESGFRKFGDYAKAMVADFGEDIKPYLLSFWEGARNYPNLDTNGMTSVEQSKQEFDALNQTAKLSHDMKKVVGEQVSRPKNIKKPKVDNANRQLVQDWGVGHIDGWAINQNHEGKIYTDYGYKDGIKAAFLKDTKQYLEAVQKQLEQQGYRLHLDKKGKVEKVSINEAGSAVSGDVSLRMTHDDGVNVYVTIGESAIGSTHPQRIGIMYRATTDLNNKFSSGFGRDTTSNHWASADFTVIELATTIDNIAKRLLRNNSTLLQDNNIENLETEKGSTNERPTSSTLNTQGTSEVRTEQRSTQHRNTQTNNSNVETGKSTGSATTGTAQPSERSGIRSTRTNVADNGQSSAVRNEPYGRKGTSGTDTLPVEQPTKLESNAAIVSNAKDFHMADPDLIFGGTQKKRFENNKKALELLEELRVEGRQATAAEQIVLASYTGWGSFGQDLFQGTWNTPVFKDGWKDENLWLREKLGKESWESAKDSIVNAFFTDPYTVQAMWSMAEKMGFTGGRILEPAVGTGNFISLMPMKIKQRSQVTAIDLDITTAAIAKQLFPESNVQNMPYQKSKTPDDFYDLVMTNVPFSNDVKIADRRYNQLNPNLHDYFFLKTLDQVRPGGIVMAITSSGTMDKQSEVIRRELAKKAELITSIRLPSGAFKEFAGTAVVTDIIVLRKRQEPLAMTPQVNWIGLSEVKTSLKPVKVNSFYAENLRNVLGTIDYKGGDPRFAGMTVHSPGETALKRQLETLADLVPENALLPRHTEDHLTYYANKAGERTNTLTMSNGEMMFVYGDQMVKATDIVEFKLKDAKKTAKRQQEIEDLIEIRKAYTDLTDAERSQQHNIEDLRKSLNDLYQTYVKEYGSLSESFGLQYFKKVQDAYYYSLAALEVNGKPAEIFKRSVVRGITTLKNPTVSDAFVIERNKNTAPSLINIAKMANVSEEQARTELIDSGAVYELPNGDIVPSDMYLSGNVRLKLEEAQNAVNDGNSDLQRNVEALKQIIPEDIPYFNIEAKLGATWVPLSDYEKYIGHLLGMTDTNGIEVTFPSGKWKVKLDQSVSRRTEATTNYGSKNKSFQTVISAALSNQTITVKYKNSDGSESVDIAATEEVNEKVSKIKEDFAMWLWSDPERRIQLEKEYNHTFNAWATPKYDGSFMSMQGMALNLGNGPFNLRQHQQNAIWRAIVNRRSINAHEVGTGKTFTMGGIALESRRYGIAKKPLILAHNANSAAVAKEIQMMYPSARILFISELGKAVRQVRMRQIANDDWDVVVMPHSMIDKLTLSEETLMAMAADDIAALEAELEEALLEEGGATLEEVLAMDSESINKKMGFKNPTAKELAKTRLKLLEDIRKQAMDASKADAVNFEELGVDMIMVDEVHEFKKPSIATRMKMKGLNTSSNKRSVNLQLLTRYVRRMNNGGNVHTFTGTPITNTLTEIYHQMRYVMEEEMQKLNVSAWDGWFGSFATDITDIELSATGEYQLVTRLAGFVNVPELRKMIGQFMDIVFANDMPEMQPRKTQSGKILSDGTLTESEKAELLNGRTEGAKDRPYKKVINITTEMSPRQEEELRKIQDLAKEWETATGKQKREWMRKGDPRSPLSISTAAKKASYDARITDPKFIGQEGLTQDFEMSKASQVVKNVMEIYNSHPLASQVIFADSGYNTTTERSTGLKDNNGKTIRERVKVFSPIKDIVERLVQQGIPREQIVIVDGSVKAEARKAIADKVNTGEIRVVIGLTQTLGVGVNMQKNLRAMHQLDAPWMPGELEQRNGRGLRQGNQWNTVLEYRYITDKLDGKSWQVLAIKDRFINSFMKADGSVRSIEGEAASDNDGDNAGDIMSSFSEASGDPRVLQRIKTKEKLEKLQRKERLHTQGIADMKKTIGDTQRRVARFMEQIAEYINNNIISKIQKILKSQSEIFSMEVDGKKYDKRKEAEEAIKQFVADHIRIGSQKVKFATYAGIPVFVKWNSLDSQETLSLKIGEIEYQANTLRGLENKLRGAQQDLDKILQAKSSAQDTIDSLSKVIGQPFGQAEQLLRTKKQLENIEKDLEQNPVAPPIWLRRGAPIDSEVYYKGKLFIVSGHRYTKDGWFVSAEDTNGLIEIPYMEATDSVGMPIYEEKEFVVPNIEDKTKSEKNDTEKPLYSRSRENKAGSTVKQVRDVLVERFGKATIEELERQGKLEIIQEYQVEGVEGFYYNGKAVLVASNLTSESTVPTFLHELGGHAGFQNMMNQEQYSELMRQFDKLVEQGNPVALAAKLLAEREQGNVRQQLEYLPYLLTLSSTMQQRNVVQRNALQKLIQNIVSYVKAWVFDNFGINLNLNPDDMLALSERMVNQIKQQSSLDTVRQKYQGTSQWMTAPNGEKSNLNEQQWLQVRTPEFKKWFGDWENDAQNSSQVLDENGEPKVVYHGTNAEFNEFKKGHGLLGEGIYLTDSFDTADMYANNRGKNGFVLPLFVNIRSALNTKGNVSRDQVVQATKSGKYQGIVHQFEDQEFIVALESNQVKMAEGNTGTFNSESADIRFSRSAKETIDKLSKKISDLSVKSIKEKSSYKYTDWLGIGLSTLGRRQLTEIYNKLLPQLTKYNDLAAQMDADKNDAGAEADSIVREWANLKDENQLADLMHDATLAKIDPAKPHVKGDSVIKYKQLRADFNALSPEAQAMYIKARDAYKSHYAKVQSAIKERILRASLSSQKKADLIKQMDDQFFGYVKGVYFPLARFGKYVVVARNNLGQVESVSRAETMGEAQKARAEMMKKYPEWKVDRVILDKEFSASRDAAGRGFMSSLFDEVANLGLSPSEMVEFEDTLNQLYLSSMPDLSWAKHGIHRKGTAGFSQDARRAFAQNMFHGAGYLAKLRYGDQLAQQLDDMQKYATEQAKQDSNYDQPSAQRVIDEMNKRHDNLMNPKSHPLSSALTSFGFIYYLGLSPAAAIVNLSQTALMAYPIMGAKWGFDKAANELLKASNDFRKGVDFHKVKWEGTKTDLYKTVSSDISKFLNKDEKQAYDDAVARGVIDVTQAHDLAGIAQGEDSGIMWKTRPIMRAASVMFHSAERFNREVTFIAAYRLARQAGSNHDSAFDQAVDATYKGHFDYSSGNRPRIMQGNVAKVLLLFKQFGQNMIYTLARQTYQSIKGETDAERKEARKSLAAILAMHATFAGVLGLPMVGMMLSLASWAGGDDDDPWDAEVALRNYLAETFGPTISNLLMKGAPRALTPADISSRVGINNLLLPDVQEGLEGKRWAESAMAGALGPVAGIGLNVAKGTQEISEGHNLRGLETMLPVFLKNFAKTYRYGEEGVQDKTGVSIMDEVSSMDLLVQGMGFSPSDVRTANEGKSAIYQLDKKLNARRGRLMALWSRAKMMDDQAEMDNIWNDIEKFNEKNPSRRITRVNLNQSYKNRQRRIDRSEDGIYLSRNRQEARSAGYFAFGD